MNFPKLTITRLCAAFAVLAFGLLAVVGVMAILESERLRVHPSEQTIADQIRRLGGTYRAIGKNDWHITSVWLADTPTADEDLEAVLQLEYVHYLDIANTHVTDASLERIFGHKSIKGLRVAGSDISRKGLQAAWNKYGEKISLDE